jgi:phenylalanyl-tRNA synthetase beta chain
VENWGNGAEAIDFFDVKGDIETLIELTGCTSEFAFEAGEHPALHPGQTARILRNGELVGYLGLLDPRAQQALAVDQPVYLFELNVALLASRHIPAAVTLSRFPVVRRDIAVTVDAAVPAAAITVCVQEAAGASLTDLVVFDVYHGQGIDPGKKSVGLGMTFQALARTLAEDEVNQAVEGVVAALSKQFDASLR